MCECRYQLSEAAQVSTYHLFHTVAFLAGVFRHEVIPVVVVVAGGVVVVLVVVVVAVASVGG